MLTLPDKGKERQPAHAGEGYLASSADLMIGILFIFIIMVVYLAVEIKRVQESSEQAADPVRSIVEELGPRLRASGVNVELDPDSGVIALTSDALFDSGQSIPKVGAVEAISKTREVLGQVVPCYVRSVKSVTPNCAELNKHGVELETIMVEGHTDSDQYANDPNQNWHLGLDRARFVFAEIGNGPLGLLSNSKGQPLLGVSSYADTRPSKFSADSPDPKEKNRRVELRFILSYQNDTNTTGTARDLTRAVDERL